MEWLIITWKMKAKVNDVAFTISSYQSEERNGGER